MLGVERPYRLPPTLLLACRPSPFRASDPPGVGVWLAVYPTSGQLSSPIPGPRPEGSALTLGPQGPQV